MNDIRVDLSTRNENNEAGYHNNCAHNSGIHQLTGIGAAAGELKEGEDGRHVMADDVGITKRLSDYISCVDRGISKQHHKPNISKEKT